MNATVRYLQRSNKIASRINVKTEEGKEIIAAVEIKDSLSKFNPTLEVQYKKQAGIDLGGLSRQFISEIMDTISSVLFDRMEMESEPYNDIIEGMSDEEKKKNLIEASRPRYFITRKNDDEILKQMNLTDISLDMNKVFELAGHMFAYAAINKIPFNISLSRILLKKMLSGNKDVSEEEKLAAYVLDTGKF